MTNAAAYYSNTQAFGSVATTSCATGFYLSAGDAAWTCGGTTQLRKWSGFAPTCTAITCTALPAVTNAAAYMYSNTPSFGSAATTSRTVGSRALLLLFLPFLFSVFFLLSSRLCGSRPRGTAPHAFLCLIRHIRPQFGSPSDLQTLNKITCGHFGGHCDGGASRRTILGRHRICAARSAIRISVYASVFLLPLSLFLSSRLVDARALTLSVRVRFGIKQRAQTNPVFPGQPVSILIDYISLPFSLTRKIIHLPANQFLCARGGNSTVRVEKLVERRAQLRLTLAVLSMGLVGVVA